jgi:hypothetical protein
MHGVAEAGMVHLRLVVPTGESRRVLQLLERSPAVVNLVRLPDCSLKPKGDLVLCDVAREEVSVIDAIRAPRHSGCPDASAARRDRPRPSGLPGHGCLLPSSTTTRDSLGARFWGQVRCSSGRLRVLQGKDAATAETTQIAGKARYQHLSRLPSSGVKPPW